MSHTRAEPDSLPNALMAEYYAQREAVGLNVTECTAVFQQGLGVFGGPGIWNERKIAR